MFILDFFLREQNRPGDFPPHSRAASHAVSTKDETASRKLEVETLTEALPVKSALSSVAAGSTQYYGSKSY